MEIAWMAIFSVVLIGGTIWIARSEYKPYKHRGGQ